MKFAPDLAGYMFASVATRRFNEVFRFAYDLKEDVDPARLQQALEDLRPRFPSFYVKLQRGLFRDTLVPTAPAPLRKESGAPCQPVHLADGKPLFQVYYRIRRISIEFSHILADGEGALVFLHTLLARYLQLGGAVIDYAEAGLLSLDEPPQPEELRDDYRHFAQKGLDSPMPVPRAFCYRAPRTPGYLQVLHAQMLLDTVRSLAKAKGVTITEYLMAAYFHAFYVTNPQAKQGKKPFVLTVPVSMRKYYNSTSLRNFSQVANIAFDPRGQENFTFDNILDNIKGKLAAQTTKEEMEKQLCRNVTLANMPIEKVAPGPIRRLAIRIGYRVVGEGTSTLSNIGVVTLPPCLQAHLTHPLTMVGVLPFICLRGIVFSCNDSLHVSLSCNSKDDRVQQAFFAVLQEQGVPVQHQILSLEE